MKRLLLAASMLTALALPAAAATLDDPLHFTCATCTPNGTNIDIGNPPLNYGVQASPAETVAGPLTMDFLVPTAQGIVPSISVTGLTNGALSFMATLFSATPWTTGDLADYLHIDASPNNPLSAFSDSGAGFFVYTGLACNCVIPQQGSSLAVTPTWSVLGGVPNGTNITAFFDDGALGGTLVATANSSSLHAVPGPIVGAGIPGILGALGLWGFNWRRRKRTVA